MQTKLRIVVKIILGEKPIDELQGCSHAHRSA